VSRLVDKTLPQRIHSCILTHYSSGSLLTPRGNSRIKMSFKMAKLERFPGHHWMKDRGERRRGGILRSTHDVMNVWCHFSPLTSFWGPLGFVVQVMHECTLEWAAVRASVQWYTVVLLVLWYQRSHFIVEKI